MDKNQTESVVKNVCTRVKNKKIAYLCKNYIIQNLLVQLKIHNSAPLETS